MLRRFVILPCAAVALLSASELRPPDLGKLSQKQFQELLQKSRDAAQRNQLAAERTNVCSIPLLEVHVRPSGPNSGVLHAPPVTFDRIGRPAGPVCKNWLPK